MTPDVCILVVRDGYLVGVRPSPEGGFIYGPLITRLAEAERQAVKAVAALRARAAASSTSGAA